MSGKHATVSERASIGKKERIICSYPYLFATEEMSLSNLSDEWMKSRCIPVNLGNLMNNWEKEA